MMKAYAKSNYVLRKKKNHPVLAPDGSIFTHINKLSTSSHQYRFKSRITSFPVLCEGSKTNFVIIIIPVFYNIIPV